MASRYHDEGYFHLRPAARAFLNDVDQAAADFARLVRATPADARSRGFQRSDGKYRHLSQTHLESGAFRRVMLSDEVCAIVRAVFGARRLYATHSKVSYKERTEELDWLPHQDNGYKLVSGRPLVDGMTICVFLDDADDRNGTLQVLPRSHKLGTRPHTRRLENRDNASGQLVIETMPGIEPKSIVAKRGDILVFHLDTVHQSGPNTTEGLRPVFIFQVEPYVRYAHDEFGNRPVVINGKLDRIEVAMGLALGLPTRVKIQIGGVPLLRRLYRRIKYREGRATFGL